MVTVIHTYVVYITMLHVLEYCVEIVYGYVSYVKNSTVCPGPSAGQSIGQIRIVFSFLLHTAHIGQFLYHCE